ncbi:unnamed protein product [Menidia menidia]|uniref:(Atlantic silverside) hypothetical protein n=1 Tax=Menidia menidia TaxID=238744 RepID=A0A8S4B6T3_9TELE|nr:unnamed protein product [Menidia menidia]
MEPGMSLLSGLQQLSPDSSSHHTSLSEKTRGFGHMSYLIRGPIATNSQTGCGLRGLGVKTDMDTDHHEITSTNTQPTSTNEPEKSEDQKMFTCDDIPKILELFKKYDVDGSGALEMDEFCDAMQELYTTASKEELAVLHMKIDTNCDESVDIGELLHFLLYGTKSAGALDYKSTLFPKPFEVCIWSDGDWTCRQSIFPEGMGKYPIAAVCYNLPNNELFLANSDIARVLGRGTNVFYNSLASHNLPLCNVLYHNIFKQIVSVCMAGVVTVWDVLSGKALMQFKVAPDKSEGKIAIAFDEPQRKIISIAHGEIKMWNFSIGEELDVIPLKVPDNNREVQIDTATLLIAANGFIGAWSVKAKGGLLRKFRAVEMDNVNITCMATDESEETLVTGDSSGRLRRVTPVCTRSRCDGLQSPGAPLTGPGVKVEKLTVHAGCHG